MKTKQLTTNAMLAALCAVLGFYALDLGSIKITFESIPIIIGALIYGPIHGAIIGAIGTLISQIIRYGFSATTFLWMLPYIVCGAFIGFFARIKDFKYKQSWVLPVVVIAELLVTAINTFAIYVDAHIYGYYTPELIMGMLGIRIVVCVVKAVVYAIVLMPLVKTLSKAVGRQIKEIV